MPDSWTWVRPGQWSKRRWRDEIVSAPLPEREGPGVGSILKLIPPEQKNRARQLRNSATPAERKLWQQLRASQLDGIKFCRQIAIGPFIADVVCRTRRLVIELDGSHHGNAPDLARQQFIELQGYKVLRFWNAQVLQDIDMVLRVISEAVADIDRLAMRDCPPPTPPVPGGEKRGFSPVSGVEQN